MAGSYDGWREAAEAIVGKGQAFDRVFGDTAAEFYRIQ
jgi:predicted TIM-barrel fold metal-dependent hydrolase